MSYSLCYDGYNQSAHTEVSMTLRSANSGSERNDAYPKVAYGFSHSNSNTSMQTKPKKECAMTLRSVVTGEGATIQTIGFKAGQSKDGGLGDEREVSPTLSHTPSALEPTLAQDNGEAVSFTRASFRRNERFDISDATPTLTAKSAAGDTDVNIIQMRYIVRRLTPKEAERLMGLPDGYTIPTGLRRFFNADGEPSPELVSEFVDIFDRFNAIMADYEHKKPPKGKSYNQVSAWLKKISDPETCPDGPRYKGCGNGWATNQPRWILTRMLSMDGIEW